MSAPTPFPESLCHRCEHLRVVESKRSVFLMCKAPEMKKYAPQPVRLCQAFQERR